MNPTGEQAKDLEPPKPEIVEFKPPEPVEIAEPAVEPGTFEGCMVKGSRLKKQVSKYTSTWAKALSYIGALVFPLAKQTYRIQDTANQHERLAVAIGNLRYADNLIIIV